MSDTAVSKWRWKVRYFDYSWQFCTLTENDLKGDFHRLRRNMTGFSYSNFYVILKQQNDF